MLRLLLREEKSIGISIAGYGMNKTGNICNWKFVFSIFFPNGNGNPFVFRWKSFLIFIKGCFTLKPIVFNIVETKKALLFTKSSLLKAHFKKLMWNLIFSHTVKQSEYRALVPYKMWGGFAKLLDKFQENFQFFKIWEIYFLLNFFRFHQTSSFLKKNLFLFLNFYY